MSSVALEKHLPTEGLVLDLTCGQGEHTRKVLASTNCSVVGLDCDPSSVSVFSTLESEFGRSRFCGDVGRISSTVDMLRRRGLGPRVAGVMVDMGSHSGHRIDPSRGLDLRLAGPLDSRYCRTEGRLSMAEVLNNIDMDSLTTILKSYGGVIKAKAIACDVVESRYLLQEVTTTGHLLQLLVKSHEKSSDFWDEKEEEAPGENIDKAFLALRRFVNDEVNELVYSVKVSELLLAPGENSKIHSHQCRSCVSFVPWLEFLCYAID